MIKGKSPYPFETIALAVGFTPRLEALVKAVRRMQQQYDAKVVFIHVGKKTSEKQRLLSSALNQYGFNDSNAKVFWEQGDVTESILRVCKQQVVDLLVMGALSRQNRVAYYLGTVSRDVARKAKCSVLLLTDPQEHAGPFKKIAVNGHDHIKTPFTVNTALYLADKDMAPEVVVVNEVDVPAMAMSISEDVADYELELLRKSMAAEVQVRQRQLRDKLEAHASSLQFVSVSGRSGHSIGQFARTEQVDLLVVNSPDHSLSIFDRIFIHDIEHLLSELPCNLLVVHSRFGAIEQ